MMIFRGCECRVWELIPDSIGENISVDNTWAKRIDPDLVSSIVPLGDAAHEAHNAICESVSSDVYNQNVLVQKLLARKERKI